MKYKKYKICSIEDMANAVTEENLDNFIEGMRYGLTQYLKGVEWIKEHIKKNPLPDGKKLTKNTDYLLYSEFEFIDDGKQENEIELQ